MTTYVLDSFALLALYRNERSADRVEKLIEQGRSDDDLFIASVNLGEVLYKTIREKGPGEGQFVLAECLKLPITIVPIDQELALDGAIIKGTTPISYADCIAAALAQRLDATLVTGDTGFEQIPDLKVEWLQK